MSNLPILAGLNHIGPTTTIIVSLSGGKDSVAMLAELVRIFGPERLIAHYQVIPLDWEESLPYNQELCHRLGVRLVSQQIIYEPRPDTTTGVRRREIRDIHSPTDIVPWGSDGIADISDMALRRGWPPSAAVRYCTAKSKVRLLDGWVAAERKRRPTATIRPPGTIADASDLALRRGWPPSAAARYCTSYLKRDLANAYVAAKRADMGSEIVIALGERSGESPRRAKKSPWHYRGRPRKSYDFWNWLPLHEWRRVDVFRCLREWGIDPHPAYKAQGMTDHQMYDLDEEGGARTSCRGCIYASRSDLCHQAQIEANRPVFERLAYVEEATGHTWWSPGRFTATELGKQYYDDNNGSEPL